MDDETDIVDTLLIRGAAGDAACKEAATEILRLRRVVGERASKRKREHDFRQLWKALNPKLRVRTHGLPFHEKVKARTVVDEATGCWVWQGGCSFNGYGRLRSGPGGKATYCHKIMYDHYHGPLPEGHVVMHTCDNRRCVNPDHLRSGTHKENMLDMVQKGRSTSNLLTEKDVREIHRLSENGVPTYEIAHSYCVSHTAVYDILCGRRWGWIKAECAIGSGEG